MKYYLLHVFCFLFLSYGFSQNTYVPDDNFEQRLIDLGYDSGPLDDYVLTANINTVTAFVVPDGNVSDFTGIEDFIALELFNCYNNDITSLDLSQNINLEHLHASYCSSLSSIDLGQNMALKRIDIWNSGLTSLDISQNIALTDLNVPNNNLTSLDITQNTALTRLHVKGNLLNTINVTQNPNLDYFNCESTGITSIDVTDVTSLRYFVFSNNNITTIDLSQNANLEIVYCKNTDLITIDLSNNTLLKRLTAGSTGFVCLNLDNGATWRLQTLQLNADDIVCIRVSNIDQVSSYWSPSELSYYSESCDCVEVVLSVDEFFDESISVYPNPTFGEIAIDLEQNIQLKNIEIYNMHGELVKAFITEKIKIEDLSTGIYLMKISTDKGAFMKKIIKK